MSEQTDCRRSNTKTTTLQTVTKQSIAKLLRLLDELVHESKRKHCQSKKLDIEVDKVDIQKKTIERHLIHSLKASDTNALRIDNKCITLNQNNPKLVVYNKDAIPEPFSTISEQRVIDEKAIRVALQKGQEIPGVTLQPQITVEISENLTPCGCS